MSKSVATIAAAVLSLMVAVPAPAVSAAVDTEPTVLSPESRLALTQTWVDTLWSYYSTGQGDLSAVATAAGIADLRAYDWRLRAVDSDGIRFEESPSVVRIDDWDAYEYADGEQVSFGLELVVDVAPYAETYDSVRGTLLEVASGKQRRVVHVGFRRDPGTEDWLVDEVGPLKDVDFRFRLSPPAPPQACPGLKTPRRGADPWTGVPWCTAGGDGKRVFQPRDRRDGRAPELDMVRGTACWAGTHRLHVGWPPGTAWDGLDVRTYVRDPGGVIPKKFILGPGYRRSVRLPADAISTGITNGKVTIWTSKRLDEDAVLIQVGRRFERWPRTDFGCV